MTSVDRLVVKACYTMQTRLKLPPYVDQYWRAVRIAEDAVKTALKATLPPAHVGQAPLSIAHQMTKAIIYDPEAIDLFIPMTQLPHLAVDGPFVSFARHIVLINPGKPLTRQQLYSRWYSMFPCGRLDKTAVALAQDHAATTYWDQVTAADEANVGMIVEHRDSIYVKRGVSVPS